MWACCKCVRYTSQTVAWAQIGWSWHLCQLGVASQTFAPNLLFSSLEISHYSVCGSYNCQGKIGNTNDDSLDLKFEEYEKITTQFCGSARLDGHLCRRCWKFFSTKTTNNRSVLNGRVFSRRKTRQYNYPGELKFSTLLFEIAILVAAKIN